MKKLLVAIFVIAITAASCRNNKYQDASGRIASFIEGTYTRSFEGEYSKGNDTLVITQPDKSNNYYTIEHIIFYQLVRNNQLSPVEYKTEKWIAILNKETNVLEEQQKGKKLSFLPDENALLLGSNRFNKMK